jgi:hypothetical protein
VGWWGVVVHVSSGVTAQCSTCALSWLPPRRARPLAPPPFAFKHSAPRPGLPSCLARPLPHAPPGQLPDGGGHRPRDRGRAGQVRGAAGGGEVGCKEDPTWWGGAGCNFVGATEAGSGSGSGAGASGTTGLCCKMAKQKPACRPPEQGDGAAAEGRERHHAQEVPGGGGGGGGGRRGGELTCPGAACLPAPLPSPSHPAQPAPSYMPGAHPSRVHPRAWPRTWTSSRRRWRHSSSSSGSFTPPLRVKGGDTGAKWTDACAALPHQSVPRLSGAPAPAAILHPTSPSRHLPTPPKPQTWRRTLPASSVRSAAHTYTSHPPPPHPCTPRPGEGHRGAQA